MESVETSNLRWMRELEFVQCLANPKYLQFLAQNRYFNDPAFLNYLKYLNYWREPAYAKYIVYPYCLEMLSHLQHPEFRAAVASEATVQFIHQKEFFHWHNWRAKNPGPFEEEVGGRATSGDATFVGGEDGVAGAVGVGMLQQDVARVDAMEVDVKGAGVIENGQTGIEGIGGRG
ncbi:hypothetical protein HK101_009643 [Irineochytrium annulatum]|nr:hypothetical protein HK101_009643 [Irineochytrium annulatum]